MNKHHKIIKIIETGSWVFFWQVGGLAGLWGGQSLGYACQHLHGGIGIDVDYPMHRYYLWAKQNELTLGSAPLQLERLGARLADGSLVSAD